MSKTLKEGLLAFEGVVEEILGGGLYKIKLTNNHYIKAYLSGRIKKNKIKIIVGDLVKLEVSTTDLTTGRITLRK